MKSRALAASVLMAMAGSASAAINQGASANQSGELFFNATILDPATGKSTKTFSYDTGLKVSDFLAKTPAELNQLKWDFSADAKWADFKNNDAVVWNFYGANVGVGVASADSVGLPDSAHPNKWGIVTTLDGGASKALDAASAVTVNGLFQVAVKIDAQASAINAALNTVDPVENLVGNIAAPSPADYSNFGGNFNGGWKPNTEFATGAFAQFTFIGRDQVASFGAKPVARDFVTLHLDKTGILEFKANGPAISVVSTSIEFGSVGTGSTKNLAVTVTNLGTQDLDITSVVAPSDPFGLVSEDCTTPLLAPNATCTVTYKFAPVSTGSANTTATITSNDANAPSLTLNLSGTGAAPAPAISVQSSSVSFGTVGVGATKSLAVTVTNSGNADLPISAVSSPAAPFSLKANTCTGQTITVSATCTLTYEFAPTQAGAANATSTIESSVQGTPPVTLDLSGTGGQAPVMNVIPGDLDFGAVKAGKSAILTATVRNDGTADLTNIQVGAPSEPFSIVRNTCKNKTIKPGKTCLVGYKLKLAKDATDVTASTSTLSSNDAATGEKLLNLLGSVGTVGDSITIDAGETVDIGLGGEVTITGSDFGNVWGKVLVGTKAARIIAWTNDTIVFKSPKLKASDTAYDVKVISKKRNATASARVKVHAPALAGVDPASVAKKGLVTLSGEFFGTGKPVVQFLSGAKKIAGAVQTGNTDGFLTVKAPRVAGAYTVKVKNFAGESSTLDVTVTE